jgi:arabinogalactan oligomer / maltooligosaccharide transport system substrate-binding protein
MKNKPFFTLIVGLLLVALMLAACGSDTAEPSVQEPAAVQEEPAAEEPAAEEPAVAEETASEDGLTITLWTNDTHAPAFDVMADAAMEEFGVTLIIEVLPFADLFEQFNLAAPAGEGPDILVAPHNLIGEFATNGLAVPLELGELANQYSDAALVAWQYDGEQYGLPFNTENVGFFINTDIVSECPATWTDVMEISREIAADNDADIKTNKYGFVRMEGDPYHFYPLMTAFGGYVFGRTDEGYNPEDVGLDSEGALAAAEFWDEYVKEGLQPPGVDGDTMMTLFESGQSAMTITGPWYTQRVIDSGINFEICPIPGEVSEFGEPFMGSFGYVISAFGDDPNLMVIFLKEFLGTEENMRIMYETAPKVPAQLDVLASIDDPYLAAYGVAGRTAQPMPAIPEMSAVWSAFGNAVTLVSQQSDEPVNAFTTAAEQIRTAIAEGQ